MLGDDDVVNGEVVLAQTTDHTLDASEELVRQRQVLIEDLEAALNLCRDYQRVLSIAQMPDPHTVKARRLLSKWGMTYYKPSKAFRIFVDGKDITEHPDSIDAEVVEELHLTAEEYYGQERAELVADEEGHVGLQPKENDG